MSAQRAKQSISEIQVKIQRQLNNNVLYFCDYELDKLEAYLKSLKEQDRVLSNYIIIRLVTLLECIYRETIKDIVNFSSIYANKVIDQIKNNVQIDMDFFNALTGKKITMGDIISQVISIKRFDIFISIMVEIDSNFKKEMILHLNKLSKNKISWENIAKVFADLNENRNILVHEVIDLPVEENLIIKYIYYARLFLKSLNGWLNKKIGRVEYAKTQLVLNINSFKESQFWNTEIRKFIIEIIRYLKKYNSHSSIRGLVRYYQIREKGCKEYAHFNASFIEGGTIYPLVFNTSLTEARKLFLEELKNHFTNFDGKIYIGTIEI